MEQIDDVLLEAMPTVAVENVAMDQLKEAAWRVNDLAGSIITCEKYLKALNEEHRELTTQKIPALMAELGELSEVKSSWGTVKLSPFWSGKITPETEVKAFAWLEGNGHGGIVKRDIHVPVPKGEDEYAKDVREALRVVGADFEEKQGVHFQTLQGFIRAMAKAGTPVPQDLFNVYTGVVAKVAVTKE